MTVAASTLADPLAAPGSADQIQFAIGTFVSVLILHWLLWRFIVPAKSPAPRELTSFIPPRSHQSNFSGLTGFGYVEVTLYCLDRSGHMSLQGPLGFLSLGLLLIGIRMAVRLRSAFHALNKLHDDTAGQPPVSDA